MLASAFDSHPWLQNRRTSEDDETQTGRQAVLEVIFNDTEEENAWGAGRFGFQKEMNALQSLTTGNEEEAYNTTALLKSTHEVEERIQEVYR